MQKTMTLETVINAPIEAVWTYWNEPEHITKWAFASDDWELPHAENDLRVGGKFRYTMAAKDGSQQFDFSGTYTKVAEYGHIAYILDDNRKVMVTFENTRDGIHVKEIAELESENTTEIQRRGWQAILDNFKKYTEKNTPKSKD